MDGEGKKDEEVEEKEMEGMGMHMHNACQVLLQDESNSLFTGKVNMQPGKTVAYHLYITDTMVNFTGKPKHAYAINGTIPGPDLVFTEGDTAEIYLHNMLKGEETSLHWHGVILPNRFDGVPYLQRHPYIPAMYTCTNLLYTKMALIGTIRTAACRSRQVFTAPSFLINGNL